MMRHGHGNRAANSGFTLVEALVAISLMGVILTALATITAQWLPNWNRGFARAQRSELVSIAMNRLIADIGASEFITPNRNTKNPLFDGTEASVIFVRSAVGPNRRTGLEIVQIARTTDRDETAVVRSTTPFALFWPKTATPAGELNFATPVVLLRAPYRISFAYAGRDGIWKSTWRNARQLPAAVRLTVSDATTGRTLSLSTTALIHVDTPAACVERKDNENCTGGPGEANDQFTPERRAI